MKRANGCRDCRYTLDRGAFCERGCAHILKIDSEPIPEGLFYLYCVDARKSNESCGPTKRWFKPREESIPKILYKS